MLDYGQNAGGAEAGPTRNAEGHSILERGLCSQAVVGGDAEQSLDGQSSLHSCACVSLSLCSHKVSMANNGKVKALSPRAGGDPRLGRKGGHPKGPCALCHEE